MTKKGKKRAKMACDTCGCKCGGIEPREHLKARNAKKSARGTAGSAFKLSTQRLEAQQEELTAAMKANAIAEAENKMEKERLVKWEALTAKRVAAQEAKQAKLVAARLAKEQERQAKSVDRLLGTMARAIPTLAKVRLEREIQELKPARGAVCTESQSRIILLLLISLTKDAGLEKTAAISKVRVVLGARAFFKYV